MDRSSTTNTTENTTENATDRTHTFRSLRAILCALMFTGFLALGCDSGTQEPDAPEAEPAEYGVVDPNAEPDQEPAKRPSGEARTGAVDSSRFPQNLPEGVSASVPDNFPSDISIYPGSSPAQGRGVDNDGSPLSAVQLITNDAAADVYDFYVNDLRNNGWEVADGQTLGNNSSIKATKGDCTAQLLITPAEGGGSDVYLMTGC